MQTLVLLELTLAKLHLWSVVSIKEPYLKKIRKHFAAKHSKKKQKCVFFER